MIPDRNVLIKPNKVGSVRGSDEQEYSLGGICAKTSQKYSISGTVVLYADAPCVCLLV